MPIRHILNMHLNSIANPAAELRLGEADDHFPNLQNLSEAFAPVKEDE